MLNILQRDSLKPITCAQSDDWFHWGIRFIQYLPKKPTAQRDACYYKNWETLCYRPDRSTEGRKSPREMNEESYRDALNIKIKKIKGVVLKCNKWKSGHK